MKGVNSHGDQKAFQVHRQSRHRAVAVRGSRVAFGGDSATYFYSNSASATTVSLSSATTPASVSITIIGDMDYVGTNTLYLSRLTATNGGSGNMTAIMVRTTDHSTYSSQQSTYAFGSNVSPPATSDCSGTLPKFAYNSTTDSVHK